MGALKGDIGHSGIQILVSGVWGDSEDNAGVTGTSATQYGVGGESLGDAGVQGTSPVVGVLGICPGAVAPDGNNIGIGVVGFNGDPEIRTAEDYAGGLATTAGVMGWSDDGCGVYGIASGSGPGIHGESAKGVGVQAHSTSGVAISASSDASYCVVGVKPIQGDKSGFAGLFSNFGVRPIGPRQVQIVYFDAAHFDGHVNIAGDLFVGGTKGFKIDHPLDPENKTLKHCAIESPDMKNMYDGVARLDKNGHCVIKLPNWFCALNDDFRYQLTALDDAAPNLYVSRRVAENKFSIAGGVPGKEVSWQVTGIRRDAWANAYRMKVEENKAKGDRGRFSSPQLFKEAKGKTAESALPRTILDCLNLQKQHASFRKRKKSARKR